MQGPPVVDLRRVVKISPIVTHVTYVIICIGMPSSGLWTLCLLLPGALIDQSLRRYALTM